MEKVKEIKPGEVEVKFGVKVTGEANWVVAKAATEGSFEITLKWSPDWLHPLQGPPAKPLPRRYPSRTCDGRGQQDTSRG